MWVTALPKSKQHTEVKNQVNFALFSLIIFGQVWSKARDCQGLSVDKMTPGRRFQKPERSVLVLLGLGGSHTGEVLSTSPHWMGRQMTWREGRIHQGCVPTAHTGSSFSQGLGGLLSWSRDRASGFPTLRSGSPLAAWREGVSP